MADATATIKTKVKDDKLKMTRPLDIGSGETLYKGTLVSIDASGYAVAFATNLKCAGIAFDVDTNKGKVLCDYNQQVRLVKSDASIADIGKLAYGADNQSVTLTRNTALLGNISEIETGYVWVKLDLLNGLDES